MLNRAGCGSLRKGVPRSGNAEEPTIDLVETFCILQRRAILIMCILLAVISGAVIYLATALPRYTATSMLLFDVRKLAPFQQQGYPNAAADSAFVDSQVEVLKSEYLAGSVIQKLDLLSDPEFAPSEGGATGIRGFIREAAEEIVPFVFGNKRSMQPDRLASVIRIFRRNLTIKRVGLTYIVSIGYRALDPNKAARISNAVAEAYIVAELDSKSQAARRANTWLQDRLRELRSLAENTEQMVAESKAKNSAAGEDSVRLNEQQLANLSTQRRVILRDLESSAQIYRALHETLLQRVAEFTQQQSFPAADARVVSAALPPLEKSEPQEFLVLGVTALLGLVVGVGAAFAREYVDDGLRSPMEVEKKAGVICLGVLPNISGVRAARQSQNRWLLGRRHGDEASGCGDEMTVVGRHHPRGHEQTHAGGRDGPISASFEQYRFAVDKPLSRFAETIRSLKVAAEIAEPAERRKVIGVTSAVPREGKSIVAANLGGMIAASGNKVLLIDANPRSCVGLTRRFAPEAKTGLLDAALGDASVEALVWRDPNTNLDFLPMVRPIPAKYYVGIASPSAMQNLLQSVQHGYDYVIIDLPPIIPVADVKAVSHLIDYFILVIEYGRTSQDAVIDALTMAPLVSEKLLGAVLNRPTLNTDYTSKIITTTTTMAVLLRKLHGEASVKGEGRPSATANR